VSEVLSLAQRIGMARPDRYSEMCKAARGFGHDPDKGFHLSKGGLRMDILRRTDHSARLRSTMLLTPG